MNAADAYEKALETVREQFHIVESFSTGNRASWYQEVAHLLNMAKIDLTASNEHSTEF